ncbi:MAG: aldo/keto reductase, partial [Planctomycetota bacterium]
DGSATAAVKSALYSGYRHIDCAPIYMNEKDVGQAFSEVFQEGSISREDVWITSKLWCNRHRRDLVEGALKETLADLQLEYLDLYMIHWPVAFKHDIHRPESGTDLLSLEEMPLIDTWGAMEECLKSGLCKNIGVCNFSQKKLQLLLDQGTVKPAADQVECHPFFPQDDLREFCQNKGIQLVAYSPLGSPARPERMIGENDPSLFEQDQVKQLATSKGITVGQVLLAWAISRGTVAIPKSANPERQKENLAAGSIELSADEIKLVDEIAIRHRFVHGEFWVMEDGPYTLANLWDE